MQAGQTVLPWASLEAIAVVDDTPRRMPVPRTIASAVLRTFGLRSGRNREADAGVPRRASFTEASVEVTRMRTPFNSTRPFHRSDQALNGSFHRATTSAAPSVVPGLEDATGCRPAQVAGRLVSELLHHCCLGPVIPRHTFRAGWRRQARDWPIANGMKPNVVAPLTNPRSKLHILILHTRAACRTNRLHSGSSRARFRTL